MCEYTKRFSSVNTLGKKENIDYYNKVSKKGLSSFKRALQNQLRNKVNHCDFSFVKTGILVFL